MHIPWHRGAELTANEKRAVAGSIQKFQLGESGQGRHFLRCAQRHAARTGDNGYVTALRLFIAEENCHADALGRFLDSAGIPRLQREWSSGLFRWLRQRAGLDLIISVLITAEIIAKVYYAALRQATGSTVLRRICEQLLCDEVMHIRFQSERLAQIRQARFRWWAKLSLAAQKLFFEGACVVIWFTHLRVFRAAGFSFSQYWRKAHHEFENAARMMSPWYRQPARRVTRTWFSA